MAANEVAKAMGNLQLENIHCDKEFDGKTSVFKIKIKPGSTVHRYDVLIIKDPDGKKKELTKQNDPGLRTMQRECCSDIIEALFKKTTGFGVDCKYVYDGKKILYTTKPISIKQTSRIGSNDLEEQANVFLRNDDVTVTITPNESYPKLDYSDLRSGLVADVTVQADRSVRTFLEILTSQYLINAKTHQYVSAGCLFENRTTDLISGCQLRVGFKKGVRIGVDESNDPKALLVVDMKRSAFFASKKVIDIYSEFVKGPNDMAGKREFNKFMKGVRCVVSYAKSRSFPFKVLTRNNVDHPDYKVSGKLLPQFVKETKGFDIRPNFPGAHPDQPKGGQIIYPLELIEILPGQLIPVEKMSSRVAKKLLDENSIFAKDRYNYIMQQVNNLATGQAKKFFQNFGVEIDNKSNTTKIKWSEQTKILVGGKKITAKPDGSWQKDGMASKFYAPSKQCKDWIVAFDSSINESIARDFITKLISVGRKAGMEIKDPKAYRSIVYNYNTGFEQLHNLFIEGKKLLDENSPNKYRFIYHIDWKKNETHDRLKLYEAYYKILTQQMLAENMSAGPQTLHNLAMKLNTKTFGLTFVPDFTDMKEYSLELNDDLLIIGYDVAHPTKLDAKEKFMLKKKHPELENIAPSVVGICANRTRQKFGFAGDYFYQQSRKESVSPTRLRKAVKNIVEAILKYGRTADRVIVYRDGVSEGQFQMVMSEEFLAVRQGITDANPSFNPKITFLVATKDHNKRVFRDSAEGILTSQIGDHVYSDMVRRDIIEFFQQTHTPLKGMAKMMQLSVLVNELEMPINEIEKLTMKLSNMHQICNCPTSLPLPIYLSHETAKRGSNNYDELYKIRFQGRPNAPRDEFAMKDIPSVDGIFDYDKLTEVLGYGNSNLGSSRYNA